MDRLDLEAIVELRRGLLAYEMGLHFNYKAKSHFEQNACHFPLDEVEQRHEVVGFFGFFGNDLDLILNVLIREILCMVFQQVIVDLGQGRGMFATSTE